MNSFVLFKLSNFRFIKFFQEISFNRNFATHKNVTNLIKKGLPTKFPIPGIQNVVLVASNKGGVGKSSVTVNLAFSLKRLNKKVGILDADVFGPSIPRMLNLNLKAESDNQKLLIPLVNYGIQCMSMGFLIDKEKPVVWRGLMVMQAISQLLRNVKWGELDFLLIDMPPGTGDVSLSILQNIPVSGAVIVTTPQEVAIEDTNRSILMFQTVNCKILGLIQNMCGYLCTNCGHENFLFGQDGAIKLANKHNLDILGDIPIDKKIQICCDLGKPLDLEPNTLQIVESFDKILNKILSNLGKSLI